MPSDSSDTMNQEWKTNSVDKSNTNPASNSTSTKDTPVDEIVRILQQFEKKQLEEDKTSGYQGDWILVAMVLDRFLLFLFALLTIITTAVILSSSPDYSGIDYSLPPDQST